MRYFSTETLFPLFLVVPWPGREISLQKLFSPFSSFCRVLDMSPMSYAVAQSWHFHLVAFCIISFILPHLRHDTLVPCRSPDVATALSFPLPNFRYFINFCYSINTILGPNFLIFIFLTCPLTKFGFQKFKYYIYTTQKENFILKIMSVHKNSSIQDIKQTNFRRDGGNDYFFFL